MHSSKLNALATAQIAAGNSARGCFLTNYHPCTDTYADPAIPC